MCDDCGGAFIELLNDDAEDDPREFLERKFRYFLNFCIFLKQIYKNINKRF